MPKYWMITNRDTSATNIGSGLAPTLSYYLSDTTKAIDSLKNWKSVSEGVFRKALAAAAAAFPLIPAAQHENQKHVTLFVHGYNNEWKDAAKRYQQITDDLYGADKLGICVLFTWPSDGQTAHYLADRDDARASGPALSQVFNLLYDQALAMQKKAADGTDECRAKVSVIAHSMGNWVLQNALQYTWERYNKPLLVSLINQCVMVAADVDNDLFASGEAIGDGGSEGMANLCYRITALYSGKDSVLGLSAGFKHFGKRRLGRSGLDLGSKEPDNVWDHDCSALFKPDEKEIHSAYFYTPEIQRVLRAVLQGYDRNIVAAPRLPVN
jgi:esterase/lipase superfamily enzyme